MFEFFLDHNGSLGRPPMELDLHKYVMEMQIENFISSLFVILTFVMYR